MSMETQISTARKALQAAIDKLISDGVPVAAVRIAVQTLRGAGR